MSIFLLDDENSFPPVEYAGREGLLAVGGDLNINRLISAYRQGIFPWYSSDSPILWWSPDPRMILLPNNFILRKSLRNTLNKNTYEVRFDTNFREVIKLCAQVKRKDQEDTWITPQMMEAYIRLHKSGYCHSAESYHQNKLVGGLYGVSLGKAFFGESMFHTMRDASKVALYYLVKKLQAWNFDFIDVQQDTQHLRSLGARPLSRNKFLTLLKESLQHPDRTGNWNDDGKGN